MPAVQSQHGKHLGNGPLQNWTLAWEGPRSLADRSDTTAKSQQAVFLERSWTQPVFQPVLRLLPAGLSTRDLAPIILRRARVCFVFYQAWVRGAEDRCDY